MSGKSALLIILTIDIIAIIIALILGETPDHYFGEEGFITDLSFFQLLVISGLAGIIFIMRIFRSGWKGWKAPFFVWLFIAIGFIYLALDEVWMIHENMDFSFHRFFNIRETGITDRIDDIIIGFYGLIGLMVLYFYRKELKKYREVLPLLIVGFILLFSTVVLDILTNRMDILIKLISNIHLVIKLHSWLSAIEEIFKIIAEGVFIGVFYYCLKITKNSFHKQPLKD